MMKVSFYFQSKLNWTRGFPVDSYSNIIFWPDQGTFINKAPTYIHGLYCMIPKNQTFTLRGVCKSSILGTS